MSGFARNAVRISDGVNANEADVIDKRILTSTSIKDTNGNEALVTEDGQLHVVLQGVIDSNNSSDTPLSAGGVFTGTASDISNYAAIVILARSDQDSADNGLSVQFSDNGIDWYIGEKYTVLANKNKFFTPPAFLSYMRIVYTNGAVDQTDFDLHVELKKTAIKWSSHNIDESISDNDDAELVKAVNTGKDPEGTYRNVNVTVDGDMKISDNSDGLAIAKGDVTGHSFIHKFGQAPDFDQADGEVTIWDAAEDGTAWQNMKYDYSTTADIDSISSSNAGDTQNIVIQGLDGNYNLVTQTATLNGQTRVALSTPLLRVFRAYNDNGTSFAGHVVIYVNGTLSGGVPTNTALIRAVVDPTNQQTLMAVYTIPAGYTGYLRSWYAATAGASKASNYRIKLISRLLNKVFRVKHVQSIGDNGTSSYQHKYVEPQVFPEKTDIEMTVQMLATGGTAASVSGGFDIVLVQN